MPVLVVDEYGCFLGKHGDMVQVRKGRLTLIERPFDDLSCINIEGRGVSLSVDLIHECARRGIPVDCVAFDGEPYAKIMSPMLTATVETRREQLEAYDDTRGSDIAKALVGAKLANQRNLLMYYAKYRKAAAPDLAAELHEAAQEVADRADEVHKLDAVPIDAIRGALINLEGRAANTYWQAVWRLLPEDVYPGKREHRGATDPVNCMLNYGYGILYSQCWTAVLLAGLDPFGGFIHVDRPGKPSLVLDLQEVFRQPAVDRVVIGLLNKGFRPEFEEEGRLEKTSRRRFAAAVLERLSTPTPVGSRKEALKGIIVATARSLAVAVRGEKPLKPYVMRW